MRTFRGIGSRPFLGVATLVRCALRGRSVVPREATPQPALPLRGFIDSCLRRHARSLDSWLVVMALAGVLCFVFLVRRGRKSDARTFALLDVDFATTGDAAQRPPGASARRVQASVAHYAEQDSVGGPCRGWLEARGRRADKLAGALRRLSFVLLSACTTHGAIFILDCSVLGILPLGFAGFVDSGGG